MVGTNLELFYCLLMTPDDTHKILLVSTEESLFVRASENIQESREKESALGELKVLLVPSFFMVNSNFIQSDHPKFKGTGAPQPEPFRIDAPMQAAGHPQRLQTPTVPWCWDLNRDMRHVTVAFCPMEDVNDFNIF